MDLNPENFSIEEVFPGFPLFYQICMLFATFIIIAFDLVIYTVGK